MHKKRARKSFNELIEMKTRQVTQKFVHQDGSEPLVAKAGENSFATSEFPTTFDAARAANDGARFISVITQ